MKWADTCMLLWLSGGRPLLVPQSCLTSVKLSWWEESVERAARGITGQGLETLKQAEKSN